MWTCKTDWPRWAPTDLDVVLVVQLVLDALSDSVADVSFSGRAEAGGQFH